jgi:hypothetical protein
MNTGRITLWANGERRFTLEESDGRLELTFRDRDQVIRSELCENEHEARDKAQGWLIALEAMRDEIAGQSRGDEPPSGAV